MKRTLRTSVAAIVLLGGAGFAWAQSMGHRPMQGPRGDNAQGFLPQRADMPLREMQQRQELQPPGRMSPEERRQLRRDINEAGREIYRPAPQHPTPNP